jgi:hypothetical protein
LDLNLHKAKTAATGINPDCSFEGRNIVQLTNQFSKLSTFEASRPSFPMLFVHPEEKFTSQITPKGTQALAPNIYF